MITQFLLTILIVGFVTAGLNIRFDRFFTILLLLFIFGLNITNAINIFLWVIMLGALMILLNNKEKISKLSKQMKLKLFVMIPIFTLIASFVGSWLFVNSSSSVLLIALGILAILYGLRLVFIHFEKHELEFEEGHPIITKICGLVGPWISGFFIGFVGTSIKAFKIPFAIKIGKMNVKQVYLGNTISTFFASFFTIIWHFILSKNISVSVFYEQMILGLALLTGIHFIFELTNLFFKDKWRKGFQILIGVILVLVSIKVFLLI